MYQNKFKSPHAKDIEEWKRQITFELIKEFTAIQNGLTSSGTSTTIARSASGGGGGSSISTNLTAGQISVGTSATLVGYSSISNPIVLYRCINSNNESVGCDITSITSSNFTATALESATLYYAVLGS